MSLCRQARLASRSWRLGCCRPDTARARDSDRAGRVPRRGIRASHSQYMLHLHDVEASYRARGSDNALARRRILFEHEAHGIEPAREMSHVVFAMVAKEAQRV